MPEGSWKKKDQDYYFGGAGLGINLLCDYLLDGSELDEHQEFKKCYLVKDGETAIKIANVDPSGAEISLISPLTAFEAVVEDKPVAKKSRLMLNTVGLYSFQERRAAKRRSESRFGGVASSICVVESRGQTISPKLFGARIVDEDTTVGTLFSSPINVRT